MGKIKRQTRGVRGYLIVSDFCYINGFQVNVKELRNSTIQPKTVIENFYRINVCQVCYTSRPNYLIFLPLFILQKRTFTS